jgi:peroxiredoxin
MRFAAALLAALAVATLPASALGVPHAGDPAPDFSLPKIRGGSESLTALRGKPVYLNFFASWCAPCNDEAPSVAQLYKKYHPKGLVTIGVDELENKDKAAGFAHKFGLPYDIVVDSDGKMGQNYGALGLPVHVFIDRHGKVSTYRLGEMNPKEIEDAVKKIL